MSAQKWLLLAASIMAGAASAQPPSRRDIRDLKPDDEAVFLTYLKEKARPPDAYVIGKFTDHDVVILGEMHENRDNLEFIAGLIAPLYHKAGVRCLATEFLRYKNTARCNRIVTAPEYQENAVTDLYRDFAWIWGFKEYMDIFKAIWALNRSLPPGAEKFRVLGLDIPVLDYDLWVETDPGRKDEIQKLLSHRDQFMADNLLRDGFSGGKVLLHTGFAHSPTHRQLPPGRQRLGGRLHANLGDRVFQICLHLRHSGSTRGRPQPGGPALPEFLEGLFAKTDNRPIGFDVAGSPFADLTNRDSPLFDPHGKETIAEFTRGYVFLKPLAQVSRVTWVDGFVNAQYFEQFRYIALRRGWIKESQCQTPADLDKAMKSLFQPGSSAPPGKAAKVDPALFEAYAGTYRMDGNAVTVSRVRDTLWVDFGREGKVELLPESATVYFWIGNSGQRIVFSRTGDGKIDRLIVRRTDGSEVALMRVGP